MSADAETLAQLVDAAAGTGRPLTFVELAERCINPDGGYQPSANLLWKVARGMGVKVNPELVGAIAAGLDLPPERVFAAAAFEYTGYVTKDLGGATVVYEAGADSSQLPRSAAVVDEWSKDERRGQGNRSGR